jgi:hypothetical protein
MPHRDYNAPMRHGSGRASTCPTAAEEWPMRAEKPRLNSVLAISLAVALIVLAINGRRILDALGGVFGSSPPADLIIVAPTGAEKV